jgi:hypothetical protein
MDASPMSRAEVLTPTANGGFTNVQEIMSVNTDDKVGSLIPSISGQRIPIELNLNPVKNRNNQAQSTGKSKKSAKKKMEEYLLKTDYQE